MKVLIASIFALFVVANAASLPEDSQDTKDKSSSHGPQPGLLMVAYVMREIAQPSARMAKLIGEAFPDVATGAKDVLQKLDDCLENVNTRNVTVCAKLHDIANECMRPVNEYYEKSLPESAKDIPKAISESYVAVIHHVCNSKTEDFLELSNQCLFKPGTPEQRDQIKKAYEEKIKIFKAAPTKANLCEIVNGVRPLYGEAVKSSCQSDATLKAFLACFDASAKPCNA